MPTVLRIGGLRVVIYQNDHAPAHVHVLGPGWVVVVGDQREARRVLLAIADRRDELIEAWRRIHG